MRFFLFFLLLFIPLSFGNISKGFCANTSDIDKLTTYATLIGRGAGCGFNIESEMMSVGRWLDRTFSADEKSLYLKIFIAGTQYAAEEQAKGKTPDSCSSIRRVLDKTVWP